VAVADQIVRADHNIVEQLLPLDFPVNQLWVADVSAFQHPSLGPARNCGEQFAGKHFRVVVRPASRDHHPHTARFHSPRIFPCAYPEIPLLCFELMKQSGRSMDSGKQVASPGIRQTWEGNPIECEWSRLDDSTRTIHFAKPCISDGDGVQAVSAIWPSQPNLLSTSIPYSLHAKLVTRLTHEPLFSTV
jgi:hypothetical protein